MSKKLNSTHSMSAPLPPLPPEVPDMYIVGGVGFNQYLKTFFSHAHTSLRHTAGAIFDCGGKGTVLCALKPVPSK